MRKITALLLALFLLLTLVACGGKQPDESDPEASFAESSEPAGPEDSDPEEDPEESEDPEDPDDSDESDEPDDSSSTGKKTTKKASGKTTTKKASGDTTTKKASGKTTTKTTTKKATTPSATVPVKVAKDNASIDWKTYDSADLFWEQHSSYDTKAEEKRLSILNMKDTVKPSTSGKTYYISDAGNDSNAGTSQSKPWKTTAKLSSAGLKSGDVVLFKRGGTYRGASFSLVSGVSYGAYGSGAKPQLIGSPRNYADASLWTSAGTNLWKISVGSGVKNVGTLVFNHGVKCARLRQSKSDLKGDFDFYEDKSGHIVYLYLSKGNPGKLYYDIEINNGVSNVISGNPKNVVIENLAIKYNGCHGIGLGGGSDNITIRGCDIGYIGGSMLNSTTRYGNGIEFYSSSPDVSNALVENNWVYQCYDAGITHQGHAIFENMMFRGNLVEYCQYNIEVWGNQDTGIVDFKNCQYVNNVLRFAGYNFEYDNRIGSNTSFAGNFSAYDYVLSCDSQCLITGNVFDTSYRYLISVAYPNDKKRGLTVLANTWIQNNFNFDEADFVGNQHIPTKSPVGFIKGSSGPKTILYANDQTQMETSVKKIDLAPAKVTFDGKTYMK